MNLFVASLTTYLSSQCDKILAGDSDKEARIFIQSLPPSISYQLFVFLNDRYYSDTLEKHLKIAKGLWDEWGQKYPELQNQLDEMLKQGWVDLDDKLTHYRNLSCPADKKGLIIIIIGLDHATDKGGLSDFHVVRENTIWSQELGCSYNPWIERLITSAGMPASTDAINALDKFFITLFQHRHRSLIELSTFIEKELIPFTASANTAGDLVEVAYENLPFWRIPLLREMGNERQGPALLSAAATFISHQSFQTAADRKKALAKITKAHENGEFLPVPYTTANTTPYFDPDDFVKTIRSFINDNDINAKQKLLNTDLKKLLQILKTKTSRTDKAEVKPFKYRGPILIGVLQAIWEALEEFKKGCGPSWAPALLNSIEVTLLGFKHNLKYDDEDESLDEVAQGLMTGIIGGLDDFLASVSIPLRGDIDDSSHSQIFEINYIVSDDFRMSVVRTTPFLEFRIEVKTSYDQRDVTRYLHCLIDDNAEERVRYQCAKSVLSALKGTSRTILPAFTMQRTFTELFFAFDADDANRLIREGLSDFDVVDVFSGVDHDTVAPQLWSATASLIKAYTSYLEKLVNDGPFAADDNELIYVIQAFDDLTKHLVRERMIGQQEVLARLYKAFFIIPKNIPLSERYLDSAIAIGISPVVAELVHARNRFLLNSFPEVVSEMLESGVAKGKISFERLLGLMEIRRPIAGLVQNRDKVLTTKVKSLGMIHCAGATPGSELSFASQSIMQSDDFDDDVAVKELLKPNEESKLIQRAMVDYQKLHPYAHDQLRILIANVEELKSALAGVHKFLEQYLIDQPANAPVFQLYLKVYSKSTSPEAVVNQLTAWKDLWEQMELAGRKVQIRIGHRYAPSKQKILNFLEQEEVQFDLSFLLHFMDSDGGDDVEPVADFEYNFAPSNVNKFPIVEHPRTIRITDELRRQTLLSNRRLRLQTCHTELSARLKHPHLQQEHYLIFGMVDYAGWREVVNDLHKKAQWVVCIDPYIDKRLLEAGGVQEGVARKIVGFSAGLGCYGELNMTVSTEADTLGRLTVLVREQFKRLFAGWDVGICEEAAKCVVSESQEISGLSLIRAVGDSEYIRDVVAYAAMSRVLETAQGAIIAQLIPIDSVKHWFYGADENMRPDLLHLSVTLDGTILRIHATLIECKLGLSSELHVAKAAEQIKAGLRRLTKLFMPFGHDENISNFDRRYWWAQLQRTIASRAQVNITEPEYLRLNVALEHLTEGFYIIDWDAIVVTLWTDKNTANPNILPLKIDVGPFPHLPSLSSTITVRHAEYGKDAIAVIFSGPDHPYLSIRNSLVSCHSVGMELPCGNEEAPDDSLDVPTTVSPELSKIAVVECPIAPEETIISSDMNSNTIDTRERIFPSVEFGSVMQPNLEKPRTVDIQESRRAVPEADYSVPERILIGKDHTGKEYFWEYGHESLQNRHLLIFGASGSGKTYAIQCLLAELARHHQNSLIVDYTDGFLPEHLEPIFIEQTAQETHLVVTDPLPINPFRFQTQTIAGKIIKEGPFKVASRIASVFNSVYSTIGEQQNAELVNTIEAGLEADENYDLEALLKDLNEKGDVARALANKITPFIKTQPFVKGESDSWKAIFIKHEGKVHILQLATVSRDVQQLITEFTLWDLYDFASSNGNKNLPLPIVLDEVQNLDHRKDSPLEKVLREGRKFGISLILATQTLSNFEAQERDRLFQAAHKLFFAPADTEIKRFADILRDNFPTASKDEWTQRLSRLQKGECLSIGPVMNADGKLVNRVLQLKITPMNERFNGEE